MGRSQRRGPSAKDERRREAIERQTAWAALSPSAQLEILKSRRGNSAKQIARINARMTAAAEVIVAVSGGIESEPIKAGKKVKAKDRRAKERKAARAADRMDDLMESEA